jgi:NAD(P)-dependent dehydrogenase (short-subunit alcohol dehydrogenase family)
MSPKTSEQRVVVITGASSGIGKACASRMIQAGWFVLAGVRKSIDAQKLKQEFGNNVLPLMIDVEDGASITAAASQAQAEIDARGLHGLVNVAGIGTTSPVEYIRSADLQKMFTVNVFGQLAVTQAFLPFIREVRGRIVNISSVGAHLAIPFGGLLNATKAAFGMLSDAMRLELRPFGIRVSVVEPGAIKTPAVEKTLGNPEGVIQALPPEGAERYGAMLREFTKRAYSREMHGSPPEVVARAVHHALTAKRPRIRYVVGKDARLLATLPKVVPEALFDRLRLRLFGMPSEFQPDSSIDQRSAA